LHKIDLTNIGKCRKDFLIVNYELPFFLTVGWWVGLGAVGQNKMCCNLCWLVSWLAALFILRSVGILSIVLLFVLCRLCRLLGLHLTIGLGEVRAIVFVQPERQMIKVTKDEDNYKSRTENFQPGLWLNRITVAHY